MFKVGFGFLLGALTSFTLLFSFDKIKDFGEKQAEYNQEDSIILSQTEIIEKFNQENGFNFLPSSENISGLKLTSSIYSKNSGCNIEFDVSSGFSKNNNGVPYSVKITTTDPSSIESKIACSKIAIEKVLPVVLRGAFAGIIKSKILEEGTISKNFLYNEIIEAESKKIPLYFDGGFVVEGLNIGIISYPKKFELYITDCKNTKCDD
jgi:hypothetical protein